MSTSEQWAKVPESVAYADLDATALRVFIIMAAKAGPERVTWITQKTIAERFEVHRSTIGRAIRRLEGLDLVRKCGRVVLDYGAGTWVQKYKVAPYLPEVHPGRTSGGYQVDPMLQSEVPEVRLGGDRSASRTHTFSTSKTSPSKNRETDVENPEKQPEEQERTEEKKPPHHPVTDYLVAHGLKAKEE